MIDKTATETTSRNSDRRALNIAIAQSTSHGWDSTPSADVHQRHRATSVTLNYNAAVVEIRGIIIFAASILGHEAMPQQYTEWHQ